MKFKYNSVKTRVVERLAFLRLDTIEEYCQHADSYFARRLKKFEEAVTADRTGSIDADGVVDRRAELEGDRELNAYFGILMTFSMFEQFLQDLYDFTRRLATIPKLRNLMFRHSHPWIRLDQYKEFFKEFNIDLSKAPYEWSKLQRLKRFRDLIAHQGGEVSSENVRFFSSEGYRVGDSLSVSINDVKVNIQLVRQTINRLNKEYTDALRKKRLI